MEFDRKRRSCVCKTVNRNRMGKGYLAVPNRKKRWEGFRDPVVRRDGVRQEGCKPV